LFSGAVLQQKNIGFRQNHRQRQPHPDCLPKKSWNINYGQRIDVSSVLPECHSPSPQSPYGFAGMDLPGNFTLLPDKSSPWAGYAAAHLQARLYNHVCDGRLVIHEKCLNIPIAFKKNHLRHLTVSEEVGKRLFLSRPRKREPCSFRRFWTPAFEGGTASGTLCETVILALIPIHSSEQP
jgi:hypothetical protein